MMLIMLESSQRLHWRCGYCCGLGIRVVSLQAVAPPFVLCVFCCDARLWWIADKPLAELTMKTDGRVLCLMSLCRAYTTITLYSWAHVFEILHFRHLFSLHFHCAVKLPLSCIPSFSYWLSFLFSPKHIYSSPDYLLPVPCSRCRSQCHRQTSWSTERNLWKHPSSYPLLLQTNKQGLKADPWCNPFLHLEPLRHSYCTPHRCCTAIIHILYCSQYFAATPDFLMQYHAPSLGTLLLSRRAIWGTYAERGQLHTTSRSGVEFCRWRFREKRVPTRSLSSLVG